MIKLICQQKEIIHDFNNSSQVRLINEVSVCVEMGSSKITLLWLHAFLFGFI